LDQGFQKLEHDRQTDAQTDATENISTLHLRVVGIIIHCYLLPAVV